MTRRYVRRKYSKEVLEEAVKSSYSVSDVLKFLGLKGNGSHQWISTKIKKFEIDTSHFVYGGELQKMRGKQNTKKRPEEILINHQNNIRTKASQLRRALLESGRLYRCEAEGCSIEGIWLGKPILLHVDHIDGDWNNCLATNLRFLCPNCHSQTPTFGAKNLALKNIVK